MGEVVEQCGGAVDKVIGDALMGVLRAPVAHEDDPTRAVRAALEIQRRAGENTEEFCGLGVRVGVNTGEVIFARVGPEARRELMSPEPQAQLRKPRRTENPEGSPARMTDTLVGVGRRSCRRTAGPWRSALRRPGSGLRRAS